MLTQDDLKAIGTIVGEQIRDEVPKIIKELVPPMIKAGIDELVPPMIKAGIDEHVPPMLDSFEERMNVKFDAVHEQLDGMENRLVSVESQMVTKSYLDDKLAHYVQKPF